MQGAQVIVLATPVFLLLIGVELAVGLARGRNTYRLNDALSSIGLGILSQLTGVFTKAATIGVYTLVHQHAALVDLPVNALWVWLAGLLLYDLAYYWHHRLGHTCALFWAAHVVHHQSEDYNLSTALRQTSSGWIVGWLFYLPLGVLGIPPLVFAVVALIDLLYQYWVHTQQIGRLGWFDRWFCAPSNHRVHHAVNDKYLDRNYGGILIVWDRLFGTFEPEDDREPCVYGTRAPLRSWNPLWANLEVYAALARDSWRARNWRDKLRVWFMPPGWRPADVAARFPKPRSPLRPAAVAPRAMGRRAAVRRAARRHARLPVARAHVAAGAAVRGRGHDRCRFVARRRAEHAARRRERRIHHRPGGCPMAIKRLTKEARPQILGTFKPVGHVIVALPDDDAAREAAKALRADGFGDDDIVQYSADEELMQMDEMLDHASEFAGFGYEITLMRRYQELARNGAGWLLVYAPDEGTTAKVADVAQKFGALAAEKYHRLVVEDLL
jgi:alkylglycerol monooxygenase